jgi:hypothetical protein
MVDDTTYLRSSYSATGPVISIYLGLGLEPPDDGGRELPLRWRALRSQLAGAGATDEQLEPIDDRVTRANPAPRTLVAFARGGRLEFSDELEDCDVSDLASFGPLPFGVPLLRWQQLWVPHVVVFVDRTGGELTAYAGPGSPVAEQRIVGPDDEIERNAPGGWAQGRYQHRAEDSWAHNAAKVAWHVERMAADVAAELVITFGDGRAMQLLTQHLPEAVRTMQQSVPSGVEYTPSGFPRLRRETVRTLVHEAAERARARVLAKFDDPAAGTDCVRGLADTVEALRSSAVRHLLIVDQPGDDRHAWISPDPLRFVTDGAFADHGTANGAGVRRCTPLTDALVRAAFAQSADVTVIGPAEARVADGLAALRF